MITCNLSNNNCFKISNTSLLVVHFSVEVSLLLAMGEWTLFVKVPFLTSNLIMVMIWIGAQDLSEFMMDLFLQHVGIVMSEELVAGHEIFIQIFVHIIAAVVELTRAFAFEMGALTLVLTWNYFLNKLHVGAFVCKPLVGLAWSP